MQWDTGSSQDDSILGNMWRTQSNKRENSQNLKVVGTNEHQKKGWNQADIQRNDTYTKREERKLGTHVC